jgi:polysaccharide export outer membrane protein
MIAMAARIGSGAMKQWLSIFLFLCVLAGGLAASVAGQEYEIGGEDLLRITVYDNPDLTTEARVSNDGKITFPLIGEVQVSGITAIELEKKIAGLLADGYIVKPQVAVFIEEYKSKKVSVLGEVAKPGLVILRGKSTLLEVISDAGGITPNAGETLTIQRKAKGPARGKTGGNGDDVVVVDLRKLFEEGDVTANIPVIDGDSIYVPKAAFVYVYGEVRNPGAYKITKGLTVLKSITIAGGFTPIASERRTKVMRKKGKTEETRKAKMDDLVLPDDIVFVPESLF